MTTVPPIEVLIPFYGDPAFLRESVRSLQDQSCSAWSATVLDDCYPHDDVVRWVSELRDPRITAVRNEQNLGANGNYKRALEIAKAEYVVILGADDRLLPTYVASLVDVIEEHRPSVIQPTVRVIDEAGHGHRPLGDRVKARLRPRADVPTPYRGEELAASLLRGNWTYFPSLCWRREVISDIGFRRFHVVQDLALLIDVIVAGGTLVLDPRGETFEYRRHRGSDSALKAAAGTRFDEEREFFEEISRELAAAGWPRAARAARWHWSSRLNAAATVPSALRATDLAAARRLLRHVSSVPR